MKRGLQHGSQKAKCTQNTAEALSNAQDNKIISWWDECDSFSDTSSASATLRKSDCGISCGSSGEWELVQNAQLHPGANTAGARALLPCRLPAFCHLPRRSQKTDANSTALTCFLGRIFSPHLPWSSQLGLAMEFHLDGAPCLLVFFARNALISSSAQIFQSAWPPALVFVLEKPKSKSCSCCEWYFWGMFSKDLLDPDIWSNQKNFCWITF